jgi:hypothetical protein
MDLPPMGANQRESNKRSEQVVVTVLLILTLFYTRGLGILDNTVFFLFFYIANGNLTILSGWRQFHGHSFLVLTL